MWLPGVGKAFQCSWSIKVLLVGVVCLICRELGAGVLNIKVVMGGCGL